MRLIKINIFFFSASLYLMLSAAAWSADRDRLETSDSAEADDENNMALIAEFGCELRHYPPAQVTDNKFYVGGSNRYRDIFPYADNLVQTNPYYNASRIGGEDGVLIACEGPEQTFRRDTLNSFVHMIDKVEPAVVITVTEEMELVNSKKLPGQKEIREKSYNFWERIIKPITSEECADGAASYSSHDSDYDSDDGSFEVFELELDDTPFDVAYEHHKNPIHRRKLTLPLYSKDGFHQKQVEFTHLHLKNWLDKDVVDASTLAALIAYVHDQFGNTISKEHPVVVHCSAGIGRSGVFAAAFEAERKRRLGEEVDLLAIAKRNREPSIGRPFMIMTADQYVLLHKTYEHLSQTIEEKANFSSVH